MVCLFSWIQWYVCSLGLFVGCQYRCHNWSSSLGDFGVSRNISVFRALSNIDGLRGDSDNAGLSGYSSIDIFLDRAALMV